MRKAICTLSSVTRYSQSRYIDKSLKDRDETHADFEKRIWREKLHTNKDGEVVIPPMQFKKCLAFAAKYKSQQIPGKGMATYTKHFNAGVLCTEPLRTGVMKGDCLGEWLLLKPPGQQGAVEKCMPYIDDWSGDVEFLVLDDCIPEDVFELTLVDGGSFIGLGRFRPERGGYYGRFSVDKITWE